MVGGIVTVFQSGDSTYQYSKKSWGMTYTVSGSFGIDPPRVRPKKYYLNMPHGPFSRVLKCVISSGVPKYD